MPEEIFHFKKFDIEQGKAAMKVGTDSVILGSWSDIPQNGNILDIGTGTGLLSLMAAQKSNSIITAVEIDKDACINAENNFKKSPWENRLNLVNDSIENFSRKTDLRFDLIITNPPYFLKNNLTDSRNIARSQNTINFEELFSIVGLLIKTDGNFSIIFPFDQFDNIIEISEKNQFIANRILKIYPTAKSHLPKRTIISFSKNKKTFSEENLIIEPYKRHEYSIKYKKLTKDFLLNS